MRGPRIGFTSDHRASGECLIRPREDRRGREERGAVTTRNGSPRVCRSASGAEAPRIRRFGEVWIDEVAWEFASPKQPGSAAGASSWHGSIRHDVEGRRGKDLARL